MMKKIIGKILSKRGKRNLPPSYLAPNLTLLHLRDALILFQNDEEAIAEHIASKVGRVVPMLSRNENISIDMRGCRLTYSCTYKIIRALMKEIGVKSFKKNIRFISTSDCSITLRLKDTTKKERHRAFWRKAKEFLIEILIIAGLSAGWILLMFSTGILVYNLISHFQSSHLTYLCLL